MAKISFNAQALGISGYDHGGDMSHASQLCPPVAFVSRDTSVEALFKILRLSHIKCLPSASGAGAAEDVNP